MITENACASGEYAYATQSSSRPENAIGGVGWAGYRHRLWSATRWVASALCVWRRTQDRAARFGSRACALVLGVCGGALVVAGDDDPEQPDRFVRRDGRLVPDADPIADQLIDITSDPAAPRGGGQITRPSAHDENAAPAEGPRPKGGLWSNR